MPMCLIGLGPCGGGGGDGDGVSDMARLQQASPMPAVFEVSKPRTLVLLCKVDEVIFPGVVLRRCNSATCQKE